MFDRPVTDLGAPRAAVASPSPILPLCAERLVLNAGGRAVLNGIDLALTAGRLTLLLGPNGAGKSLLLRALHGLIDPSAGQVTAAGAPLSATHRAAQAMVFQKPVLLRRSVQANMDFVLRSRGFPISDGPKLLARVDLLEQARQPARRLSGGEQQRLALARALATRPRLLFLDEPTANLDPASALRIEEIVRREHDAGTKVVFVTHDVAQARRMADEIVFLHRGQILEHAPAAAFFAGPKSRAAADFLEGRIVV